MEIEILKNKIKDLERENSYLKKENNRLLKNIQILEEDKQISESLRAESFVASLVQGAMSTNNAFYDVKLNGGSQLLEVKFSRLNLNDRKRQNPSKRWAWSKPFGESGNKEFNNLILIGLKDDRFINHYLDPKNPFIIFDVPYSEIMPLTIQTNGGKYRSIQLTTNPETANSSASPLFSKYQITSEILENRYSNRIHSMG